MIKSRVSWADAVEYHFYSYFTGLLITANPMSVEAGTFLENQVNIIISNAWCLRRQNISIHGIDGKVTW